MNSRTEQQTVLNQVCPIGGKVVDGCPSRVEVRIFLGRADGSVSSVQNPLQLDEMLMG